MLLQLFVLMRRINMYVRGVCKSTICSRLHLHLNSPQHKTNVWANTLWSHPLTQNETLCIHSYNLNHQIPVLFLRKNNFMKSMLWVWLMSCFRPTRSTSWSSFLPSPVVMKGDLWPKGRDRGYNWPRWVFSGGWLSPPLDTWEAQPTVRNSE